MRRLAVAGWLVLAAPAPARADPPTGYLGGGVDGGVIDGYVTTEGFADGGGAIAGRWLWLRGRLAAGTIEDTEIGGSHAIASAMIGVEVRGCDRFACAVGGLDVGPMIAFDHGARTDASGHLHLGVEVRIGERVALRAAFSLDPAPGLTGGLAYLF